MYVFMNYINILFLKINLVFTSRFINATGGKKYDPRGDQKHIINFVWPNQVLKRNKISKYTIHY